MTTPNAPGGNASSLAKQEAQNQQTLQQMAQREGQAADQLQSQAAAGQNPASAQKLAQQEAQNEQTLQQLAQREGQAASQIAQGQAASQPTNQTR
jgi:hypothetical protein